MVAGSMLILQHMVVVRQPDRAIFSPFMQAFQQATTVYKQSGCKRRSQRHLLGHMACASSSTLAQSLQGNTSTTLADQDIFLIAGAGIAGLAMAAALIKVRTAFRCCTMCV